MCRKPSDPAHAPFCSRSCRDRDLIQWLDGGYVLPGRPFAEGDEDS
ncbi:DNA gyrase inhibitor YacG [Sandaracinobacteroides sp. A072]